MPVDSLSRESAEASDATMPTVSESSLERTIVCGGCGKPCVMAKRFCGHCGNQLWEPCLDCNNKNAVDERYCGNCGVDLDSLVRAAQREISETIENADRQAAQGRFLDAIATLEKLAIADHSRLADLAQQVTDQLTRFPEQRQQAIDDSSKAADQVKQLMAARQYHKAHQILTNIPKAFYDQPTRDLFEQLESIVAESVGLRATIKKALATQNYDDLLPHVQRLAHLNPDDEPIEKLRAQLQHRQSKKEEQDAQRLAKIAKSALAKCDYKQAMAAVNKIPTSVNGETIVSFIEAVKERVWLADQLRTAPHVSPTLIAIAQRLVQLQPHDQRHAEIAENLANRWAKTARDQTTLPVYWAKPSEKSELGLPVDLLRLPAAMTLPKGSAASSSQGLLVAYGLALQAIGQATVSTDLAPRSKKASWIKRSGLRGKKKLAVSGWGIDIGSRNLKAIELCRGAESEDLRIVQTVVLPIEEGSEVVERFLKHHDLADQVVAINLSGAQTLGRFFDLPAPNPRKFAEAVQFEMRSRIPLKEEQSLFDFHWTDLPAESEDKFAQRRVVLVAANRTHVAPRLATFDNSEASRLLVQSDSLAIYNTLRHSPDPAWEKERVAVLELGAASSNLVVLAGDEIWFRGLFVGTNTMDQALAKGLQVTQREAERIRLRPERSTKMHKVDELLVPEFEALVATIQRTINQYQHEVGKSIDRLLLCGQGAQQHGLLQYFLTSNGTFAKR